MRIDHTYVRNRSRTFCTTMCMLLPLLYRSSHSCFVILSKYNRGCVVEDELVVSILLAAVVTAIFDDRW